MNNRNSIIFILLLISFSFGLFVSNFNIVQSIWTVIVQAFSSIMLAIFVTQYQARRGRPYSFYKVWRTALIIIMFLSLAVYLLDLIPENSI